MNLLSNNTLALWSIKFTSWPPFAVWHVWQHHSIRRRLPAVRHTASLNLFPISSLVIAAHFGGHPFRLLPFDFPWTIKRSYIVFSPAIMWPKNNRLASRFGKSISWRIERHFHSRAQVNFRKNKMFKFWALKGPGEYCFKISIFVWDKIRNPSHNFSAPVLHLKFKKNIFGAP